MECVQLLIEKTKLISSFKNSTNDRDVCCELDTWWEVLANFSAPESKTGRTNAKPSIETIRVMVYTVVGDPPEAKSLVHAKRGNARESAKFDIF